MSARRVLHVMGTADIAGTAIARIVENLAAAVDPSKYEIETCFLADGPLIDHLRQTDIKSSCVHWTGRALDLNGTAHFAALLRSSSFNIIHLHTGGRLLNGLSRWFTDARIVRHVHGCGSEHTGAVGERRGFPESDALIAVSRVVADFALDRHAIVIHPGVDISQYSPEREAHQGRVIGTACRLEPIKGINFLIHSLPALATEFLDLRLEIAGDGSLRSALEQQCRDLGIEDRVTFLGWRKDISTVMTNWDVFVIPSHDEGFPVAALEAMAAGLPIVASAVGGLCEMVVDGETGLLAQMGNPADLALRIRELLMDSEKRHHMGVAARQRVIDHFSVTQMTEKIIRVYDTLLPESGRL